MNNSDTVRNAVSDVTGALMNGGFLRVYSGNKPISANTPISSQTLLAELRFGDPAFQPAVAGIARANPIAPDEAAAATGTATWFRILQSDGVTTICDGTIGAASTGFDLNICTVAIVQNAEIDVTGFDIVTPES